MEAAVANRERGSEPTLLPLSVAAERMGISRTTAYNLARANKFPIPVFKIGQQWRVNREHLDTYLRLGHWPGEGAERSGPPETQPG